MSRLPKIVHLNGFRKIETLIADFQKQLIAPEENRRLLLYNCASQVGRFMESLMNEPSQVSQLLDIVRRLRDSSGTGVITAEKTVMEQLVWLAFQCAQWLSGEGEGEREGELFAEHAPQTSESDEEHVMDILVLLVAFARECFVFKRPRDAFGGERRALAFELLGMASPVVDLSDVVPLARDTLKAKNAGRDASGALQFLESYYSHNDEAVSDAMEKEIKAFAKRADRRALAVGALNVLVETNCISDLEAMSRIGDW